MVTGGRDVHVIESLRSGPAMSANDKLCRLLRGTLAPIAARSPRANLQARDELYRQMTTGIALCVTTRFASLPRRNLVRPR